MSSRFLGQVMILSVVLLFSMNFLSTSSWSVTIQEKIQEIRIVNKKDRKERSHAKVSIHKNPQNQGQFLMRIEGEGEYAGYKNVRWLSEAEIDNNLGEVKVLITSTKIISNNKIVFSSLKRFDYSSKLATVEIYNNKSKPLNDSFPIKGPICDDVTMIYFLNKIVSLKDLNETPRYYLLTNEPKLYHVIIKSMGEENIKLVSGEYKAEKFQLMADLGPLTDLAPKIVPPTYIWFDKNDPENWIQYEGMETGYETANIITYRVDSHK